MFGANISQNMVCSSDNTATSMQSTLLLDVWYIKYGTVKFMENRLYTKS